MTVVMPSPPRIDARSDISMVVNCYSLFDKFFPTCGLLDYTEGIYDGDATVPYEQAQLNQIRYVLDEAQCSRGTRILEIGCGNGSLLEEVRHRGAMGTGMTISPEQVARCRHRGLDVLLMNYRDLDESWELRFDAVVANGSIEHFVQAADAAAGKADDIYRRMFELCHRVIDPDSPIRRFVNTTIHFIRVPRPDDLLKIPLRHRLGSDNWHWAWLNRSFGGFYPTLGQFERCVGGMFELIKTVDGTNDYRLTSEEWLLRIRVALRTRMGLKALIKAVPVLVRHPRQTIEMLTCMLGTESWNWQFRTPDPPTRLLRQTWIYR